MYKRQARPCRELSRKIALAGPRAANDEDSFHRDDGSVATSMNLLAIVYADPIMSPLYLYSVVFDLDTASRMLRACRITSAVVVMISPMMDSAQRFGLLPVIFM